MREDLVILAILFFAVYNLFFSISIQATNPDCSVGNSGDKQVKMCMGTDISTQTTKPYLFGLLELPVYRWGFNIEYLHYAAFLITGLLAVSGFATINPKKACLHILT